jgi:RimJ/RimL family protein N-acetyltransferase
MTIPAEIRTPRLLLRPWRADDAALLLPILEANTSHLRWIPTHVAAPAPLPDLAQRLSSFAADFQADRNWRFAIFSLDERDVFGEVSLFPRSQDGRVPLAAADRLEIGYWLREDVTGHGYATEATQAMISLAATVPGMRHVEIRCDAHNHSSAAIPARLGFQLANTNPPAHGQHAPADMLWLLELPVQL